MSSASISIHAPLNDGLARSAPAAIERARRMSAELERVGIRSTFEGAMRYAENPNLISRAHFGPLFVETKRCKDVRVFEAYLVPASGLC